MDTPRFRDRHVVAVVCSDCRSRRSPDYKTGKNAVILCRR